MRTPLLPLLVTLHYFLKFSTSTSTSSSDPNFISKNNFPRAKSKNILLIRRCSRRHNQSTLYQFGEYAKIIYMILVVFYIFIETLSLVQSMALTVIRDQASHEKFQVYSNCFSATSSPISSNAHAVHRIYKNNACNYMQCR